MDGLYRQGLNPPNSGTPDAWITFRADDCALPILEGEGDSVVPDENGDIPSGVYMAEATYLRFVGIVSRYWDTGFGNGWTGEISDSSNGHIEYINCIGDGNGRTAFAMYSARGFTVRECISAHNGGSPTHSWSSGVQLYAVQGAPEENVIERTVSFENVDGQKNNDGSGFIVDEETQGATFRNNLAFRNGGSCMRLTRSNNTLMSNFSCYHNGMNPDANSPTNPGELYWTDQQSRDTTTLVDSIAAASGSAQDPEALRFPPETGLSNNLTIDSGETPFFTDPDGINPDFRPPASAAAQVENLGTAERRLGARHRLRPEVRREARPDGALPEELVELRDRLRLHPQHRRRGSVFSSRSLAPAEPISAPTSSAAIRTRSPLQGVACRARIRALEEQARAPAEQARALEARVREPRARAERARAERARAAASQAAGKLGSALRLGEQRAREARQLRAEAMLARHRTKVVRAGSPSARIAFGSEQSSRWWPASERSRWRDVGVGLSKSDAQGFESSFGKESAGRGAG